VFTDPELIEAGHYVRVAHPVLGVSDMPAPPMRFSASTIEVGPAPNLGEHNHEILVGLLGMAPEELDRLVAEGALQ
jgi:crotonobetainyl-CoA:carnitine CoA-transferase CaiB-like acyl-CoA transferase